MLHCALRLSGALRRGLLLPGAERQASPSCGIHRPLLYCRLPQYEACTPLRASYVTDLSDAALAAAGASDKVDSAGDRSRTGDHMAHVCRAWLGCRRLRSMGACNPTPARCVLGMQVVRQSVVFSPADPENPSEDCLVNGEHFSLPDCEPLLLCVAVRRFAGCGMLRCMPPKLAQVAWAAVRPGSSPLLPCFPRSFPPGRIPGQGHGVDSGLCQ